MSKKTSTKFIPIKTIRDNVVVRNDGTLVSILFVTSINFSLKSAEERSGILFGFQELLNSLNTSVQILCHSRKIDITPYLKKMTQLAIDQKNELLKVETEEYRNFIQEFTDSVDIMDKEFYFVVTFAPPRTTIKKGGGIFSFLRGGEVTDTDEADKIFKENISQLQQRMEVIRQGLSSIGLRSAHLTSEQIIDLLYTTLNPQ